MTINIAIELLQKSKFDTDAEATDYADYLAGQVDLKEYGQVDLKESDLTYCKHAHALECLRLDALENEMKKTDPYSEEWEKMAADWTYCSTRIIAFTWLYHALSHYERR